MSGLLAVRACPHPQAGAHAQRPSTRLRATHLTSSAVQFQRTTGSFSKTNTF